ncbi:hypothetical protein KY359_06645 [Candidatus Woesearchaeota archaeon]|nr:hypothetical protein [Candidatus Woesearchaeota archaeon]
MKCAKCNNSRIKTRKNYSHGTKSKARVTHFCMECGSTEMAVEQTWKRGFRRR